MLEQIEVKQNTDEWFALRTGRVTSSKLPLIMANFGKSFGEPAKKYAINVAVESITSNKIESMPPNAHMLRGIEQEPLARMIYEDENFCTVTDGGFFAGEKIGCSPDGLVGEDGVIEIKSVIPSTHYANIKRQGVDPAYRWQCIGNLMFTGRKWLDFVSYCADFPEDKQVFTYRMHKEDLAGEFGKLEQRLAEFIGLVCDTKILIEESEYRLL